MTIIEGEISISKSWGSGKIKIEDGPRAGIKIEKTLDAKTRMREGEMKVDPDDFFEVLSKHLEGLVFELEQADQEYKRRDEEAFQSTYYDLLRLHYRDDFRCHIPVPIAFRRLGPDKVFELKRVAEEEVERSDDYYSCPSCGESSFYQGMCESCLDEGMEFPESYRRFREEKESRKRAFWDHVLNREIVNFKSKRFPKISQGLGLEGIGIEKVVYVKA